MLHIDNYIEYSQMKCWKKNLVNVAIPRFKLKLKSPYHLRARDKTSDRTTRALPPSHKRHRNEDKTHDQATRHMYVILLLKICLGAQSGGKFHHDGNY